MRGQVLGKVSFPIVSVLCRELHTTCFHLTLEVGTSSTRTPPLFDCSKQSNTSTSAGSLRSKNFVAACDVFQ